MIATPILIEAHESRFGTDHAALLTRARKVAAAAADGDRQRLQREAGALLHAFAVHVADEQAEILRVGRRLATVLLRGQRRLHRDIIALAVESEAPDIRRCERMAAQIEAVLSVQAAREHRILSGLAA